MSKWMDIESAPKDGTPILAYAPANKRALNKNARYPQIRVDRRREKYNWRYAQQLPEAQYTAWMPLPEPPSDSTKGEG